MMKRVTQKLEMEPYMLIFILGLFVTLAVFVLYAEIQRFVVNEAIRLAGVVFIALLILAFMALLALCFGYVIHKVKEDVTVVLTAIMLGVTEGTSAGLLTALFCQYAGHPLTRQSTTIIVIVVTLVLTGVLSIMEISRLKGWLKILLE